MDRLGVGATLPESESTNMRENAKLRHKLAGNVKKRQGEAGSSASTIIAGGTEEDDDENELRKGSSGTSLMKALARQDPFSKPTKHKKAKMANGVSETQKIAETNVNNTIESIPTEAVLPNETANQEIAHQEQTAQSQEPTAAELSSPTVSKKKRKKGKKASLTVSDATGGSSEPSSSTMNETPDPDAHTSSIEVREVSTTKEAGPSNEITEQKTAQNKQAAQTQEPTAEKPLSPTESKKKRKKRKKASLIGSEDTGGSTSPSSLTMNQATYLHEDADAVPSKDRKVLIINGIHEPPAAGEKISSNGMTADNVEEKADAESWNGFSSENEGPTADIEGMHNLSGLERVSSVILTVSLILGNHQSDDVKTLSVAIPNSVNGQPLLNLNGPPAHSENDTPQSPSTAKRKRRRRNKNKHKNNGHADGN